MFYAILLCDLMSVSTKDVDLLLLTHIQTRILNGFPHVNYLYVYVSLNSLID